MKRIKFIFILIFFALPIFFLTSCEGGIAAEAINRVSTTQDKKVITEDFVVNAKILYEGESFLVEWNSNNAVAKVGTEFVDNTGKSDPNGAYYLVDIDYANNTETDQIVTLTATIKKGSSKGTKDITFTVPKAVGVPKEELDLSKYNLTSIPDAIEIANAAGENKTTERYYIYGTVKSISSADYGAMYITDGTNDLYIYGMYNSDGTIRYNQLGFKPAIGDEVIIYANLCTYNGEPEVHSAWLIEFKAAPQIEMTLPTAGTEISIAKAIDIANYVGENATTDRWIIKATVKTVSNPQYGEMTITDGTDEIYVYGTYDKDGVKRYSELEDKPVAGDSITLSVNLSTFKGTPQVKAGWIQEFTHNTPVINPADYKAATITEAREAADDAKLKITGTVAIITYASGMIADGVILVGDNSSIYVYGRDIAGQVKVGNTITVAGSKDFFIAENEVAHAKTHGYIGACQISNAVLVENDNKVSTIDYSFAEEKTVKELMDTPFSENVTSLVIKSTAIVTKDPQKGYTNYYINDLDGTTGSYVYTKCNGGDFTWLDEFDGQICTVYFTALNAKSQDIGCIWRLQPVKVEKIENYTFDETKAPEFAIEYYAANLFKNKYTSDPALEVVTTTDITKVNITGIQLTYASSNNDVIYFETVDGKTVMHTKDLGTANVTITAKYGSYTATRTLTIKVEAESVYETITVADAVEKEDETEVTVKGVVTCGQQNKPAVFFLTDETGIVAVEFANAASMAEINVGDEVVIKGKKSHSTNKGNVTEQVYIYEAELLANYYGNKEYSTESFVEVTVEQLLTLAKDMTVPQTTTGYIVKGKITKLDAQYYINYYFGKDATDRIQFYGGSGTQFNWLLDEYLDQEITVEIVMCDWSNKSDSYRFTIVAIHTADGKVINTYSLK